MTETREWQQLEGEYEYPQVIGTKPTVCCDVPRQHMNDLGRSALIRKVDNDKPMYLSIPSDPQTATTLIWVRLIHQ